MATSPTVSVVLPNYNHAPYLARRIDSILQQTLQDFELIFLDDASSDISWEVFQPYADDPRVHACDIDSDGASELFDQYGGQVLLDPAPGVPLSWCPIHTTRIGSSTTTPRCWRSGTPHASSSRTRASRSG